MIVELEMPSVYWKRCWWTQEASILMVKMAVPIVVSLRHVHFWHLRRVLLSMLRVWMDSCIKISVCFWFKRD